MTKQGGWAGAEDSPRKTPGGKGSGRQQSCHRGLSGLRANGRTGSIQLPLGGWPWSGAAGVKGGASQCLDPPFSEAGV